jgi:hypothetical protein
MTVFSEAPVIRRLARMELPLTKAGLSGHAQGEWKAKSS